MVDYVRFLPCPVVHTPRSHKGVQASPLVPSEEGKDIELRHVAMADTNTFDAIRNRHSVEGRLWHELALDVFPAAYCSGWRGQVQIGHKAQ